MAFQFIQSESFTPSSGGGNAGNGALGLIVTSENNIEQIGASSYNSVTRNISVVLNISDNLNANLIGDGSVNNTEFQYLSGATSNLQVQINAINAGVNRFEAKALATVNVDISNPSTDTYDDIVLSNGDTLFLLPDDSIPTGFQTNSNEGGIYTFNGIGIALTRIAIMSDWEQVVGSQIIVQQGTLYAGSQWNNLNVDGGTIDVTDIVYKEIFTNALIGTLNSQTKSANGAVIIGSNLYMQTADATYPGLMSSSFYTLLDNATANATPNTVAIRTNDGSLQLNLSPTHILFADTDGLINTTTINTNQLDTLDGIDIGTTIQDQLDSKLANILTPNYIYVGNSLSEPALVPLSGDATIVESGALTLANSPTTRDNLGLGSAAVLNTGTSTGNAVQYSATNIIGNGSTSFLGLANVASQVGSILTVGAGLQFASGSSYNGGTVRQILIDSAVVVTQSYLTSQIGAASGIAPLGSDSKIPSSYLPAIAIVETFVVASQAAMLALTAQQGDVAVRTDLNQSFILINNTPSVLANWQVLLTPTDSVLSVNGYTGVVSLTKSDVGLSNVENTALSTWAGSTNITTLGTVATGIWNGTAIDATKGGTSQTSYALGDILYASATNTLSKLGGNTSTTKMSLVQTGAGGSVSAAPAWQQLASSDLSNGTNLTTLVTGTVGDVPYYSATNILSKRVGNTTAQAMYFKSTGNGTTATAPVWSVIQVSELQDSSNVQLLQTATLGDLIYSSATNVFSKLAGNTTTTKKFLSQTGNGTVSAAPVWDSILQANVGGLTTSDSPTFAGLISTAGMTASGTSGIAGTAYYKLFTAANATSQIGRIEIGIPNDTVNAGMYFTSLGGSKSTLTLYTYSAASTKLDQIFLRGDNNFIGLFADPTSSASGNGALFWGNATTQPSANPTNGVYVWATSSSLKGRGGSGTVTTIANAEPHCPCCGGDFGWEWENPKYGGNLRICAICLINDLGNKPYIRWNEDVKYI